MSYRTINSKVASLWFSLAFVVFIFIPFSLHQKETAFASPALTGLCLLLVLMGRQRTSKWQLADEKFNTIMRNVGLTTSLLACLSIILGVIN